MAKLNLNNVTDGAGMATLVNANNVLLEAALENTLSRDGTTPNTMSANLDMNSNKISNLTDGSGAQDAVTKSQLDAAVLGQATLAADNVTLTDVAGNMAATDVEAGLAEIYTDFVAADAVVTAAHVAADAVVVADLASTANAKGASLIGIEDSAGNITATTVEGALAELAAGATTRIVKQADESRSSTITLADDGELVGFNMDAASLYLVKMDFFCTHHNTPDFKSQFVFDNSPQEILLLAEEFTSGNPMFRQEAETSWSNVLSKVGNIHFRISGYVKTHATLATVMDWQWSQNSSSATAVTVKKGTNITIEKVG